MLFPLQDNEVHHRYDNFKLFDFLVFIASCLSEAARDPLLPELFAANKLTDSIHSTNCCTFNGPNSSVLWVFVQYTIFN